MIKKTVAFILFIYLIIFLAGCKKHSDIENYCICCDQCNDLPSMTLPTIYYSNFQYKFPCFNPNNSNEIIYYFTDSENNEQQLIKYNIESQQKKIIVENIGIISQPKWFKNDWILINKKNNNYQHEIWMVKSNGDSLTLLVSGGSNMYPEWYDENNIIYSFSQNAANPYFILKKDIITITIDTISHRNGKYLTMSSYKKMVSCEENGLNLMLSDYSSNLNWTIITNSTENGFYQIEGISWHPNNKEVYYTRILEGIYKINIDERIELKIKNACDSRKYSTISISPNGKKIIVERINGYISNDNKLYNDSRLCLMDINGCNEKELIIN